jgi:hypothetical protein
MIHGVQASQLGKWIQKVGLVATTTRKQSQG